MTWSDTVSWDRRQVLKLAGNSAAGVAAASQLGTVGAQSSDASITIEDQEIDGDTVVVAEAQTETESRLIIISDQQVDGRNINYRTIKLNPGDSLTDRTIELEQEIPETQQIRAEIRTVDGNDELLARDGAVVSVGESLDQSRRTITLIEADPDTGFNWPYLLYTPSTTDENVNEKSEADATETRPLLVGNSPRRGVPSDRDKRAESGRNHIERGRLRAIADELNSPAVVALIPSRTEDGSYQNLRLSDSTFERLDLQLLAMVDDARDRLAEQPYEIPKKFHAEGFSSNGRFFDKLTALHPERINAISAGGNGITVLPLEELAPDIPTAGDPSTETPPWPIGVGDLQELTGEKFNRDAWFETNQFWYIGAEDQDPENPGEYLHKLYKGSGELDELISEIFGSLQVDDRFKTSQAIFEQLDAPAQFTAYEGAGHELTREMGADIIEFHRRHKHEEFGPQFDLTIEWPSGPLTAGETFSITASYENLGATEATTTSTFLVEGEAVDSTDVRIAPGDVERVEFDHTISAPGKYPVSVAETESKTFEVTAEDTATDGGASDSDDAEPTGDSSSESTVAEQPGMGIMQTLAALGGVGYLIKQRTSDTE